MKPKKVYVPIYRAWVTFLLGADHEKVNKFSGTELADKRFAGGVLMFSSKRHYIVWTAKKRDISVLVHECVHAANQILDDVGVKADFNNDEAQTYLVEFLLQNSGFVLPK